MEVQYQQQTQNYPQGRWMTIDKSKGGQSPSIRFGHISFMYKNYLYIHGGTGINQNSLNNEANIIYRMSMDTKHWQKIEFNKQQNNSLSNNQSNSLVLQQLSSHCAVLYKDQLLIFGGSNSKMQCKNDLLSLNLDTYFIKALDQKGDAPEGRQSSSLLLFKNEWLVLYGGISYDKQILLNQFRFYNLQTKQWIKIQGNYQYLIQARSLPALQIMNDKIYLFGGQYYNSFDQTRFLNDFYQVTPIIKNKTTINLQINRILTQQTPAARSGHSLTSLGNNILVLLGGQNFYTQDDPNVNKDRNKNICTRNDVWIFSQKHKQWMKIQPDGDTFKFRSCFTGCEIKQKNQIYVFGGIKNYETMYNDVMCLNLQGLKVDELFAKNKNQIQSNCRICYENINHMVIPQFRLQEDILLSITNTLEFPFSAFGLLLDNTLHLNATIVNISYEQNLHGNFIKIQDNGKIPNGQQFYHTIINFDMGISVASQGVDKKMKYLLSRDAMKKEFGVNLKIGALRLGDQFLYINVISPQQVMVTYYVKQPINSNSDINEFVCYNYAFNPSTNVLYRDSSDNVRKIIDEKYHNLIKNTIDSKKSCKNVLYIFQLRQILAYKQNSKQPTIIQEPQLKIDLGQNDLIFGNKTVIKQLLDAGYNIFQCCDISLRSYLNYLYLKNQHHIIFLSVKGQQKKQITNQIFLDRIDKMAKSRHIIDLEGMIDYDCKIVQIYFNPDIRKKVNAFHNGILIYHKGRLITRYKFNLGQLLDLGVKEDFKTKYNILSLFGYIDVPDMIPVNMFKTDFIYNIMMEKLYSRIKFIEKYLQRKNLLTGGIKNAAKKLQKLQKIQKMIQQAEKGQKSKQSNGKNKQPRQYEKPTRVNPPRKQTSSKQVPQQISTPLEKMEQQKYHIEKFQKKQGVQIFNELVTIELGTKNKQMINQDEQVKQQNLISIQQQKNQNMNELIKEKTQSKVQLKRKQFLIDEQKYQQISIQQFQKKCQKSKRSERFQNIKDKPQKISQIKVDNVQPNIGVTVRTSNFKENKQVDKQINKSEKQ